MNENAIVTVSEPKLTPVPYVPTVNTLQSVIAIVDMAYKSGMVKVKNIDDARFIALYGLELSIPVMTALRCIYSVNGGAPTCSGELMLALIRRSGKVSVKISSTDETLKAEKATVYMKRLDSGDDFTASWGKADDNRAKLVSNRDKYPAQMWTWRAVSIAAKALCSDIVGGMYTVEEIYPDANLDENGEIVGDYSAKREPAPQTPVVVQIPATTPAPVVEEVKHDPNEWVNGNVNAFLAHWLDQGMTHPQIKAALKINDRWSEWKGTVKEATEAVEAYRKPKTLPPDVEAAQKAAKPVFDGVNPPAAPAPAIIPDEAELRRATLTRLEGEAVTLGSVEKLDYVRGKGKVEGWKWLAHAQILEADDSEPRVDVTLFPEDVAAIKAAGHNFPMTDGPVYVPVVLHIEDNRIRINRETIEKKDTTPIASPFGRGKYDAESQKMFDSLPGMSDAAKHKLER